MRVAHVGNGLNINQYIGRVGRTFEINQRDAALRFGLFNDGINFFARRPCRKIKPRHPEFAEDAPDQCFGRGVKRGGMNDHIAWLHKGEQHSGDSRHAA